MILRFYSYKDLHGRPLTSESCINKITKIIISNSRNHWLRFLTELSKKVKFWTEYGDIIRFQKDNFGVNFPDVIVINRRAVLVLTQFLFSINEDEFSSTSKSFNSKDLGFLFLIINEYIDKKETISLRKSLKKEIFFTSFKIIHTSFNISDIKILYFLFNKFHNFIRNSKNIDKYNEILIKELGCSLQSFSEVLNYLMGIDKLNNKFYELVDIQSIKCESIDFLWKKRENKLPIPFEYSFLEKYPIVKADGKYYIYDNTNLFLSTIKKVFSVLADDEVYDFRHDFGQNIVEPIIKNELSDIFLDSDIEIINVSSRKFQYGDFGLCFGNYIFLFEIKSIYFKPRIRYSMDYDYFISAFDGKFIKKSGVEQQVKRIKDIDNNFEHFKQLSKLKNEKYKVFPIILSFDDSIQALGCNWYVNNRFSIFKRILIKNLKNIEISENMCIISFTELILLKEKYSNPKSRIELLLEFLKRKTDLKPFREYMETRPSI
ncbi:MAG: hypothetical protein ACOCP4_02360 [Candidatus Woesearchaeota archaeon]